MNKADIFVMATQREVNSDFDLFLFFVLGCEFMTNLLSTKINK